jgi:hypothetical protein
MRLSKVMISRREDRKGGGWVDSILKFKRESAFPNPPIAEEFWGIWMSQQRIDAEEAPWEGMGVPSWWE